jgi:hypothetical protein
VLGGERIAQHFHRSEDTNDAGRVVGNERDSAERCALGIVAYGRPLRQVMRIETNVFNRVDERNRCKMADEHRHRSAIVLADPRVLGLGDERRKSGRI